MGMIARFKEWFQSLDRRGKSLVIIAGAVAALVVIEML